MIGIWKMLPLLLFVGYICYAFSRIFRRISGASTEVLRRRDIFYGSDFDLTSSQCYLIIAYSNIRSNTPNNLRHQNVTFTQTHTILYGRVFEILSYAMPFLKSPKSQRVHRICKWQNIPTKTSDFLFNPANTLIQSNTSHLILWCIWPKCMK